jgi:hypothetical protein
VVAVIEAEAEDAADVPDAFVAVTVNVYAVLDCKPATVMGEDDPVPVYPPGEDVAVNDVAAGDNAGKENVTVAAPSLKALPVPTSVAVTLVGAIGSKKSFEEAERFPVFLAI